MWFFVRSLNHPQTLQTIHYFDGKSHEPNNDWMTNEGRRQKNYCIVVTRPIKHTPPTASHDYSVIMSGHSVRFRRTHTHTHILTHIHTRTPVTIIMKYKVAAEPRVCCNPLFDRMPGFVRLKGIKHRHAHELICVCVRVRSNVQISPVSSRLSSGTCAPLSLSFHGFFRSPRTHGVRWLLTSDRPAILSSEDA